VAALPFSQSFRRLIKGAHKGRPYSAGAVTLCGGG